MPSEGSEVGADRLTPKDPVTLQLSQGARESLAKALSAGIDSEREKADVQRVLTELMRDD